KPTVLLSNGTTLKEGTDYTLTYSNNNKEGTGTVTITGCGNYTGTVTATFLVTSEIGGTLSGAKVELAKAETITYDGTEKKPEIKVTLGGTEIDKSNYTVTYSNNVNAGTATATVTGTGSLYSGVVNGTFKIEPVSLATATIEFSDKTFPYTGDEVRPGVSVKVGSSVIDPANYTLTYSNNINMSTSSSKASVTVAGKSNCKDSKKQEFEITKGTLTGASVGAINVDTSDFEPVYNGKVQKPDAVKVVCSGAKRSLTEGTDFTVAYSEDMTNAGTVTMTVTGKGNFEGSSAAGTYTIAPKDISVLTVSGVPSSKAFSGKAIKPTIYVYDGGTKLKKGTHYSVEYSNNVAPGKAKIKVSMTGNYGGSKTYKFKINLAKPTIKSLTTARGMFTVKWKKVKGAITGYQIKYKGKKVNVAKSKSGLTVKGLKSGTKVPVKVRAYFTYNGKNYFGKFSTKKTIVVR
ncbi:MAG: fibronectin type III domain-containing protein, partial [Lachnospiraceae bacterium]|nr:fibronectin type III domain-containing protein [Lachnospiraceae bacterium]